MVGNNDVINGDQQQQHDDDIYHHQEMIAITGGSGFLAQHLIAYLSKCKIVAQICTIDRRPFTKFLDYPSTISLKHYTLDLCDRAELVKALAGVGTVFHCAGKQFVYLHDGQNHSADYWHDNTDATEALLDVMIDNKITRLIYVGDAYANLPIGDNYGLSEQVHTGIPANFMLNIYGESKTRAEICVKNAAMKGLVNALILRPTFIYGEGESHLNNTALKICEKYNGIPYIEDDNRGHHQFIYAGNMVMIMVKAMQCLLDNPSKFTNEHVYCIDSTKCTRFVDFMKLLLEANGMKQAGAFSYRQAFLTSAYYQLLSKFGSKLAFGHLTMTANRFLNGWTVGFTNRKLRLLLDYVPEFEQIDAVERTVQWQKNYITNAKSCSKMG